MTGDEVDALLGLAFFVIGLALSQPGCETSERKAAQPEPAKSEPARAAAEVSEMTADQLCAWLGANCFGEYAGL